MILYVNIFHTLYRAGCSLTFPLGLQPAKHLLLFIFICFVIFNLSLLHLFTQNIQLINFTKPTTMLLLRETIQIKNNKPLLLNSTHYDWGKLLGKGSLFPSFK